MKDFLVILHSKAFKYIVWTACALVLIHQAKKLFGCIGKENMKTALEFGSRLTPTNHKKMSPMHKHFKK